MDASGLIGRRATWDVGTIKQPQKRTGTIVGAWLQNVERDRFVVLVDPDGAGLDGFLVRLDVDEIRLEPIDLDVRTGAITRPPGHAIPGTLIKTTDPTKACPHCGGRIHPGSRCSPRTVAHS